ncbi:HVO_0234 family beta-propeller protein [Halorubrum vacuolatum]|uniref:HVO-0234-like beta-propeller domain-containing protein n=1 Tax=Halorubrum vacuolatum TaxID=63740 RepID=A0A238X2F4_HALVU|nr:hypothetical protein [Halorubrum vacuolatum]SNR52902.1 hypothetical protein SAMN06264855_11282 [Halorubrum vacuolatum]
MAPAEDDISIEEKRVYAGTAGRTDALLATGMGLVRVAISGDLVGEFTLISRDAARDVAVLPTVAGPDGDSQREADVLAVATDDDLRVAVLDSASDTAPDQLTFSDVAVGPCVAVGVHNGGLLVAAEDGTVSRVSVTLTGDSIEAAVDPVGGLADPRAIDGPLLAGADGVYRIVSDGNGWRLEHVGLSDVRDVAGSGLPLAATGDGLYWLGNGWMDALDGEFEVVAGDGDGHAMAAGDGGLWVRPGDEDGGGTGWNEDAWAQATLPVEEPIAAVGYGPGTAVAVTADGTVCVDVGDGWRHRAVGVRDVNGVALVAGDL